MRGYENAGITRKVRAAGGEIYAVSSEPQTLASRASAEWGLNFECVGDPHHEISGKARERGWLELFANRELEFLERSAGSSRDFVPSHPKGYYQPGVLAITKNHRVLYRWRSVPTHANVGGAVARPTAEYVWRSLEEAIAEPSRATDAPLDVDPRLDARGVPWIVFVPLLIANGWFLTGRGFSSPSRIRIAGLRLVGFVVAWMAAFSLLPTLPVALVLAAWAAWIVPRVRWLGRQFQDASGQA